MINCDDLPCRLIEGSRTQAALANSPEGASSPRPESLMGLRNRKRKRAADVDAQLASAGELTHHNKQYLHMQY